MASSGSWRVTVSPSPPLAAHNQRWLRGGVRRVACRRRGRAAGGRRVGAAYRARSLGCCPQGQSRSTRDLSTEDVAGCGRTRGRIRSGRHGRRRSWALALPLRRARAEAEEARQRASAFVPEGEPGEGQIARPRLPLAVDAGAGRRVVRAVGARPTRAFADVDRDDRIHGGALVRRSPRGRLPRRRNGRHADAGAADAIVGFGDRRSLYAPERVPAGAHPLA